MRWLKSLLLVMALTFACAVPALAQWDWQAETTTQPGPPAGTKVKDADWSSTGTIIAFIFFSITMAKLVTGRATSPPTDQ